ncbi:glycine zipper 2TM domain-containing protein [Paramagnetospirillum marisnigri]|uniref:glycine zipper 2TM domain-containing protein n=1 Tax=Paramagnetospirillum marisnigri TaxID=1285242 RepID=UPI0009EDFE45|nr:glycine zipper 2TM domain-containing protein [Paramagnetospirillum marisnigri]
MKTRFAVLLIAPLALSGCQTMNSAFSDNCKIGGTALGALAGGIIGYQFGHGSGNILATIAGVAAGSLIGNQIGGLLDCNDKQAVAATNQVAAEQPTGTQVTWGSQNAQPQAAPQASKEIIVPTIYSSGSTSSTSKTSSAGTAPATKQQKSAAKAPSQAPSQTTSQPSTTNQAQWKVVEPAVRSEGSSGMWGWSEPISNPQVMADGRTCRQIRQVIVDPSGKQSEQVSLACKGADAKWTVASG